MQRLSASDACVSDLALDEWLASELDAEAGARVERHLAACERCSARRAARDAERGEFLRDAPTFTAYAAKLERGPARARPARLGPRALFAAGGGALALAAAILLLVRTPPVPGAEDTRSKGGAHVGFFVKRGERVTRGAPSQPVHPGDALRFTYTTRRPAYLALINVDTRAASVYFPSAAAEAAAIGAGSDVALNFSVALDDQLGTERVYALFCTQPFALEPVRAALQATGQPPELPGCELDVITLRKEPLP